MIPFSYDQFSDWYEAYRTQFLVSARDSAVRALTELLDRELREPERVRVDVRPGRLKSTRRAWQKLNTKYADVVTSFADVPRVMDDLVGLRVVCTNNSDLQRLLEVLATLSEWEEGDMPVLAVHADSVRNYVESPKPSGYRAYHLNLCTAVNWAADRHLITCELQVRTLLQDSWGELTHEDTYKPGNDLPPLVDTLSRRMADLMTTLDDIAQDLRDEMDRVAYSAAEDDDPGPTDAIALRDSAPDREAAFSYLAERISGLDKPIDLASLAWELQREFGGDVVDGWFGKGTFKGLLQAAVPDVRLSPRPPSYVLPPGYAPDARPGLRAPDDVPRAASLLREADGSFPLIRREHWKLIYSALSEATQQTTWTGSAPPLPLLNHLTRVARNTAGAVSNDLPRRPIGYVANALRFAKRLTPIMSPELIAETFTEWTISRAAPFELTAVEIEDFRSWLDPYAAGSEE